MAKRVIYTDRVMRPIAHFSHAVRIGNTIHLGATAGTDAALRLAGDTPGRVDVAAQARRMFENAGYVLGLLGAGFEHVVRVKTYIADLRDRPVYDALFAASLGAVGPDHTIVGSAGFPLPQAAIELDLVAAVDTPIRRHGDAVAAGNRIYGSAGPGAPGAPVALGFDRQCDAAFRRLADRLGAVGARLDDIVHLRATVADSRDIPAWLAALAAKFPSRPPAATVTAAATAEPAWRLHLEAVAAPGGGLPIAPASGAPTHGPGSPAVQVDGDLFVGAQLGCAADGDSGDGVEAQTRRAWARVQDILHGAGLPAEAVLRTDNVLVDWRDYAGFNAGYGANATEPYPPRTTVLGGLRHAAARVQIEATAHRDGARATIVQVR
ncbi:MAG: hypothetical protein FJX11_05515 [Alphaproteobacteria bacterium]|nr:hypothetical protein [Alphaproteobacteria bacterium]